MNRITPNVCFSKDHVQVVLPRVGGEGPHYMMGHICLAALHHLLGDSFCPAGDHTCREVRVKLGSVP